MNAKELKFRENFSGLLRKLRMECGYRQEDCAIALGVSRSTYSYYELGETAPDLCMIREIAGIFGVPAEIFLYPEDYLGEKAIPGRRSPRLVRNRPERVGDLSSEEKKAVATMRAEAVRKMYS
ncbi:helix-turn-helix domain-containing protein [uncultured Neglectibacter sp.]|uniref:helix-turn-helix domain-containing protein n=1 Tax=uncultured Neglectibacter sp. TaxID=1924108 RepID=UPI0034DF248D